MSLSISGARGLLSATVGAAGSTRVEPVQPVTKDKPAPSRGDLDTSAATGSASGAVAALLLQRGGTVAADAAATQASDDAVSKPNLDALNRVLAHYVAQSAAAARLRP